MTIILFLFTELFFLFTLSISKRLDYSLINKKNKSYFRPKTNNTLRQLLINNDVQKLNNIISIYNPNNIVTYISSTKNSKGDIFIITNS